MRTFGEKKEEWSPKQGKNIPVWQSPKYIESRTKANELLDSGQYGLAESDFWILMNETKSGKMGYTGLIISHNGCCKINDKMPEGKRYDAGAAIDPEWDGAGNLVMKYRSPAQGLYEVGEVSKDNCKNAYPYAMVVKRLFDRVVLKLSGIAYAGIYGEDEADEFKRSFDEVSETKKATHEKSKTEALLMLIDELGSNSEELCKYYEVGSLAELSEEQWAQAMKILTARKEKKNAVSTGK